MKTRKRIKLFVSVMMLLAVLKPESATIFATGAPASTVVLFAEHNISTSFEHAQAVYATDVDGDGDVDVLGAAIYAGEIAWWENDGDESFTKHIIDGDFRDAYSVCAADVETHGDVDVLGAASYDDESTWWENDGAQNFTEHTIDGHYNGACWVHVADVDSDGDMDVLGAARIADDITWWENDGAQNFTEHTIDGDFDGAKSVYAIDVDGDGDVDVLGAAICASDIAWWENDGSQNFAKHTIDDDFDGAKSVYAIDLDGDGDVDVIGAGEFADDITWWENDGDENFSKHSIDPDFNGASCVFATDLDGDGDVDVLGAPNWDNEITWWEQSVSLGQVLLPLVLKYAGPPSTPLLDAISNPAGHYSYTVSWNAVGGATTYELEEDDNVAFSSPTTVYSGAATSTPVYASEVGTYHYRVRALNDYGTSDWSNPQSVVVTVEHTGPEPGHYTGTRPSVSFDVTEGLQVCNFDITVPFGPCYTCRIRIADCAEIAGDGFRFFAADLRAIFTITGTFQTPIHALGGYRVSGCGGIFMIPASEGTWEASK